MEKFIEDLLTPDILKQACETCFIKELGESLGDFENFVFQAEDERGACILRITHSSHRSLKEVESELAFIEAIANGGVSVSKPRNDTGAQRVEAADGSNFISAAFEFMPGQKISKGEINLDKFEILGETTARMHKVIRGLNASDFFRYSWDEEQTADFMRFIPGEKQEVREAASVVFERLQVYPRTSENYGLIHSDLHPGNLHFHEGQFHIFDFDDSCFHWLAADPAISLFYWLTHGTKPGTNRKEAAAALMKAYWKGYAKVDEPLVEFEELYRDILLFRNVQLVNVLNQKFEGKEMPERERSVLERLEKRILEERTVVDD